MSDTPYSAHYEPPAPILMLRLAAPSSGAGVALIGLVDTGADMTLVPEATARALSLPEISRVRVAGVTGPPETADVFAATIEVAGSTFLGEVVGFGAETILGRDVISRLVLTLDAPRNTLRIESPRRPRTKKRPGRRRSAS